MPLPSARHPRASRPAGSVSEVTDLGPRTTLPVPAGGPRNDSPSPSRIPKFASPNVRLGNEDKRKIQPPIQDVATKSLREEGEKFIFEASGPTHGKEEQATIPEGPAEENGVVRAEQPEGFPRSVASAIPAKKELGAARSSRIGASNLKPPEASKMAAPQIKPLGRSTSLRKPASSERGGVLTKQGHGRHVLTSATAASQTVLPSSMAVASVKTSRLGTPENAGAEADASSTALSKSTRALLGSSRLKSSRGQGPRTTRPPPSSSNNADMITSQPAPSRPAFTTHLRSFTPRKPLRPKPLTSSYLHPNPSPPSTTTPLPAALLPLQIHLLHLTLLHSASLSAHPSYTSSALSALRTRASALASSHASLLARERTLAEHINAAALAAWPAETRPDAIAALSTALAELDALTSVGSGAKEGPAVPQRGRFAAHVTEFEEWRAEVERVWDARGSVGIDAGGDGSQKPGVPAGPCVFAPELPASWHAAQASLTRTMTALRRELEIVEEPATAEGEGGESGVGRIVRAVRASAEGCVEELAAMGRLVRLVADREREWVDMCLEEMELGG